MEPIEHDDLARALTLFRRDESRRTIDDKAFLEGFAQTHLVPLQDQRDLPATYAHFAQYPSLGEVFVCWKHEEKTKAAAAGRQDNESPLDQDLSGSGDSGSFYAFARAELEGRGRPTEEPTKKPRAKTPKKPHLEEPAEEPQREEEDGEKKKRPAGELGPGGRGMQHTKGSEAGRLILQAAIDRGMTDEQLGKWATKDNGGRTVDRAWLVAKWTLGLTLLTGIGFGGKAAYEMYRAANKTGGDVQEIKSREGDFADDIGPDPMHAPIPGSAAHREREEQRRIQRQQQEGAQTGSTSKGKSK